MKTAKENICQLPEYCFSVLLESNSLIKIYAGESGYHKLPDSFIYDGVKVHNENATVKDYNVHNFADKLNADMNITKAQRKAMDWGSQFGWETRLADPASYDENGKIKKP